MANKFWDLLRESIIVQALITFMLVSTLCYLWVSGKPVPGELWTMASGVVFYWMGTKTQRAILQSSPPRRTPSGVDDNGRDKVHY